MNSSSDIERIVLDRLRYCLSEALDLSLFSNIRMELVQDRAQDFARHVVHQMVHWQTWGKRQTLPTFRWPKDWWEGVKERWFWPWMLRRWPVRYTELTITATKYFPTLNKLSVPEHAGILELDYVKT